MHNTHYRVNRTPLADYRRVHSSQAPSKVVLAFVAGILAATAAIGIAAELGQQAAARPQVGHASYQLPEAPVVTVASRQAHCWC